MKKLLLVRHCKSGWDEDVFSDFDRKLTNQGIKDGKEMAAIISKNTPTVHKIITSSAKRALTTAKLFADAYSIDCEDITQDKGIYEMDAQYSQNLISRQDSDNDVILFVGHNPTIVSLAKKLTRQQVSFFDAGGVMLIEFDIEYWNDIITKPGRIIFYEAPLN